jgi:beta-lactam-binding protein with PASTA domain
VSSGDVISENPDAGTSVTLGSAVSIVVSTGQGVNCPVRSGATVQHPWWLMPDLDRRWSWP